MIVLENKARLDGSEREAPGGKRPTDRHGMATMLNQEAGRNNDREREGNGAVEVVMGRSQPAVG